MPLQGEVTIGAAGTGTVISKNDDPVNGYLIDFYSVLANDALLDGVCRIYRGISASPDAQLAASAVARQDTAEGPYYLPPGGILLFSFSGLTPGVKAIVTYVGNPTATPPLQQGKLTFQQPLTVDVSSIPFVTPISLVEISLPQTATIPPASTVGWQYLAPAGFIDRMKSLQLNISIVPGVTCASGSVHVLSVGQGGVDGFGNLNFVGNLRGQSLACQPITFAYTDWFIATYNAIPLEGAGVALQALYASEVEPIGFSYFNGSANNQTNDIECRFMVERIPIA